MIKFQDWDVPGILYLIFRPTPCFDSIAQETSHLGKIKENKSAVKASLWRALCAHEI